MLLVNAHCIVVNSHCTILVNAKCVIKISSQVVLLRATRRKSTAGPPFQSINTAVLHCNVCDQDFKSSNTLKKHMKKKYHRTLLPSDASSQCALQCEVCDKDFKSSCTLKCHILLIEVQVAVPCIQLHNFGSMCYPRMHCDVPYKCMDRISLINFSDLRLGNDTRQNNSADILTFG